MNKYFFLLGALLLVIPLGLRIMDTRSQGNMIATYEQDLKETSYEKKKQVLRSAKEYNRRLYDTGELDKEQYQKELNIFQNGMMGSLEIPRIFLKLPIYHGVEESVLANGIGHLQESSLPTGGRNTHCVLTGHRGLPEAQLFTRLDELEAGDIFFVSINGQKLWYKIFDIQVIKPEEIQVLQIQEGKDLISLVTCTPYGINTHRLVVTGERIKQREPAIDEIEKEMISKRDGFMLLLPVICLVPWIFQKCKRKIMKKRRCRKDEDKKNHTTSYRSPRKRSSLLFAYRDS